MLSRSGDYLRVGAVDAVVAVLWVFGLTAWAEADREGVRWRGFVRRQFSWAEIERVAVVRPRLAGVNPGANLVVRVRGRNRVIGPASMVGPNLVDFARDLAVLAAERGIPADVP
jgi:hypothetical protein